MRSERAREGLKLALTFLWLAFTVSFAAWWLKFSLDHIGRLQALQPELLDHWARQKRMVLWEGSAWLVLLVLGGAALIALMYQERQRARRLRDFFASFSHDIKTSLASLRLQAETLQDELGPSAGSPVLDRLVGDTVRLQLQLENSLFLSSQDHLELFVEELSLERLIERLREQWPDLKLELRGGGRVRGDERALRTVLSNLAQNARVHGQARSVIFEVSREGDGRVRLSVRDDGKGFDGDVSRLGELFRRPRSTSGSGMGLYISRLLVQRMGGRLELRDSRGGFHVEMVLTGEGR